MVGRGYKKYLWLGTVTLVILVYTTIETRETSIPSEADMSQDCPADSPLLDCSALDYLHLCAVVTAFIVLPTVVTIIAAVCKCRGEAGVCARRILCGG